MWYADQPRQRTTMAMLILLDRRPSPGRLRAAVARAVDAVPRLRQRVVDAPFDLDFHVRRYSLAAEIPPEEELEGLFHTVGPIYERPFDHTRPLWELIEIDRPGAGSAIFFRLHHAVADGVGGNTILAALTDAERHAPPLAPLSQKVPGGWSEPSLGSRLYRAVRERMEQDAKRRRAMAGALWGVLRDPSGLGRLARAATATIADASYKGRSPLRSFGRSRHLTGTELPFEPLRQARRVLRGKMIDLMLTGVAGAMGTWHRERGFGEVPELLTLVPLNLRPPDQQGLEAGVGNRATGIVVRLPLGIADPIRRFREIHRRLEERKRHPASQLFPSVAGAMATLPRPLYRAVAYRASQALELIVTNVPGVPLPRYLAGAEITAAYPFAPVAPHTPVSIALYGYRGRLYIGLDADGTSMEDVDAFCAMLGDSFHELMDAVRARS
jgi:WS/DGAT/MGAT family acyltransferase